MPRAWSPKYERMYRHVKASCLAKRGRSATRLCTRIAAATTNKARVRAGVTKTGVRCFCPRGYRILKADRRRCWAPGRPRRMKTCQR